MVAGWDRLLPSWFSCLHPRYKTPVNSIIFVGAITLPSRSPARSAPEFRKRFNSSITPRMFSTESFTSCCSPFRFSARARFAPARRSGCASRRSAALPSRYPRFSSPSIPIIDVPSPLSFARENHCRHRDRECDRRRNLSRRHKTSARLTAVFASTQRRYSGSPLAIGTKMISGTSYGCSERNFSWNADCRSSLSLNSTSVSFACFNFSFPAVNRFNPWQNIRARREPFCRRAHSKFAAPFPDPERC